MKDSNAPRVLRAETKVQHGTEAAELEPQTPFSEYVSRLRPHWSLILGIALLVSIIALGLSYRTPKQYQATAKVLVQMKAETDATVRNMEVSNLVTLLQSQSVLNDMRRDLKLDQPPFTLSLDALTSLVSVRQVLGTNVVVVQVTLVDAERAAAAANLLCTKGAAASKRLNQQEAVSTRDSLAEQANAALERLHQSERALNEFHTKNQVEVLQTDVDVALGQRARFQELEVSIAAKAAKLAAAERELARQPRSHTLSRAVDDSQVLAQAEQQPGAPRNSAGLVLKEEEMNPVYNDLQQTIADARSDLAEMKQQAAALSRSLKVNQPTLPSVAEFHRQQVEEARLEAEYKIAKKVYEDTQGRAQQASLDIASRSSTLQVFDRAEPPAMAVRPRPFRAGILAFFAGLVLAALAVLILQAASHVPSLHSR